MKRRARTGKKTQSITKYENGFAKEFVDEYDVKHSYVYEDTREKLLVATVENAGLDEIVVIPGNKCDFDDVKCTVDDMKMNSIEWKKNSNSVKYGKFSSKVISLNEGALSAKIKKAKKGLYRFSAWVYSSEGGGIRLSISSHSDKYFDTEPSKWSFIEGELDLGALEYHVFISKNGLGNVWLQDFRLVPADAVVSVLYYDELRRQPIASVGDKEIAVYTQYDSKGRATEIYSDYIKEDGSWDVALIERNTFVDGSCLDPSYDINTLSYISVNGDFLTPTPNQIAYYNVLPGVDNLNITWKTHQEGKKVSYRIYEADKDDADKGAFQTPICCSVQNGVSTTFDSKDLVLELYVGDASDLVYKVKFSPQSFDWINYGNALDVGKDPRFTSNTHINRVAYIGSEGLRLSIYDGAKWNNDEGYDGEFEKFCSVQKDDDKAYISATRTDVPKMSEQEWQFEINLDDKGISGWNHKIYDNLRDVDAIDMAFVKDKLYTAYYKDYVPIKDGNSLFVYESVLYASKFDKDEKVLSEYHVKDFKIANSPDNQPLVAYIGKLPSQFKSVRLVVDPEETLDESQLDDVSNIPSNMLQSVSVSDYYVVIKYLSSDGSWIGCSAEEGDYLTMNGKPLLGAIRIALSSDENNVYLAVLYETEDGNNALSVYKSEKKDGICSFNILNDAATNSNIIAYLDKNDPLDLFVYDGIPYLMFANEQNDNRVSVLAYNDDKTRWLSVGNPAFASITTSEKSGNLGFDKNLKTPVIVFKERYDSKRSSLRNKVVPMKYVDEGNMDISLSSIGNSNQSVFVSQFRQYILSYSADMNCDVNELVLNLQPIDEANIEKITFSIDGSEEIRVNAKADVKIPLPSKNVVNVKINLLGKNGKRLTYQFNVYKTCPTSLKPSVSNSMNQNTPLLFTNSSSSATSSSSSGNGSDFVYEIDEKDPYICFSDYGHDWNFVAYGVMYTKYGCLNWKNPIIPEVNSSSSSYTPGSSSACDYYFKNEITDEERCVLFVIRSSSSSEGYPWWYNYSSSDPTSSGSAVNSSGSDGYSSGANSATSSTTDPASSGSTVNSSGSDGYSSGMNGDSSSSFDPPISIPGTSIPQIYESVYKYKFAATGDLKFADNANVSGNDFIGNNVEVGANSRISGQLTSTGNMLLRNNSYVEEIVVAGNLNVQNGAYSESETQQIVQTPLIPSVNFAVGEENINVWDRQTQTLYPGAYKNLHVYSNATIYFEPGVYYFESFEIEANAMIYFRNMVNGIQIWIQGALRVGDRVKPICEGESDQLMVYSNTTQLVYLGVNSELKATMIMPNANINFAPNSTWVGKAWAKSVETQPNVIVK